MRLEDYFDSDGERVHFSRRQASDFAKRVAGDFNPIHDMGSKRFCVPGDLLFAVALNRYGLSQRMRVVFSGLVGDGVTLEFPACHEPELEVRDTQGKSYLRLECSGDNSRNRDLIDAVTRCYVQFSGQTFPDILVPLMTQQDLMINPDRPLVIYESMSIELDSIDFDSPALDLTDATLTIAANRKRGEAELRFAVRSGETTVGQGSKRMLLSGLRPLEPQRIEALVDDYLARKHSFMEPA
jgi:hypothetical protein